MDLVLGTVQLGMKYGVNNKTGKPSREKALEILEYAFSHGIKIFDTAAAYGDAEEILGDFSKDVKIITKVKKDDELADSLDRVKRDKIDGVLVHDGSGVEKLKKWREEGLVSNIGVSVYKPKEIVTDVDYVQIPYNVFDQRFDSVDLSGKKVFARSAFLQGLILMDEVPDHLSGIKKYLLEFDNIIKKHGFSRKEAAILFVYCNPKIDYLVFGVETIEQLKEILEIVGKANEFSSCREELAGKFTVDERLIMPNLWKK